MKFNKHLIRLFLLVIGISTLLACKKDLSSLDVNKIDGVSIDTTGNGTLSVFQFEHLVLKPKISTTIKNENLYYEWRINLATNDTITQFLGNGRDLDAEITLRPNRPGTYHQLILRVTDKTNGLKYIMDWKVTVKNSIGEGLVVAETSDGVNTDLSHIMFPLVTRNYSGESIKRHVFSGVNGSEIPGIVKQMRYAPDLTALFGITDNSIFKVNTIDYSLNGKDDNLFFGHTGAYKPASIGIIYQSDVYIENGKFYANYLVASKKWGVPYDSKFTVPAQVVFNANNGIVSDLETVLNFYDEVNGHFVYLQSIQQFGDRVMHAFPEIEGKAFNPGKLPNQLNVAAGLGPGEDLLHLLKDKTTGKLALYVFGKAIDNYPDPLIPPAPKAKYDLSNAPGINDAIKFVLYDEQRVMYYATPTKIYVVLFGGATPVFEERYSTPAEEQITTLQMFQQSDYPYSSDPFISTNNKQLIVSTYTGTEGKVHILPIKSVGTGILDIHNIKTFGGFGKIIAITSQK
jgi:hypothetical protein